MHRAPDCIDTDGHHFNFYREHFPEGQFAGYMTPDGKHFRFWIDGKVMTPSELADYLAANYEQVSEAGIRAAVGDATSKVRYPALRQLPA